MRLRRSHGAQADSTKAVGPVINRLQMRRIDALDMPTQVVELQPLWDWSRLHLVGHAVSTPHAIVVNPDAAIATRSPRPLPDPALVRATPVYLLPEPLFQRAGNHFVTRWTRPEHVEHVGGQRVPSARVVDATVRSATPHFAHRWTCRW